MKKRIFAVLLTLCLILMLLPASALAASYEVYVAGIVLGENQYLANGADTASSAKPDSGGYAYYYNGALTLHDAVITGVATGTSDEELSGIYTMGDLQIVLEGRSSVTGNGYGIYAGGNLTVSGAGTLTVNGGEADYSYGVYSDIGSITFESGNTTANGGKAANESYGIYACNESITIKNGTVTGAGGAADVSYGVCAGDGITMSDGHVIATGGSGASGSCGLYAESDSIMLTGGHIEATGGDITGDGSSGLYSYGISASENIQLSGGIVTAVGGDITDSNSADLYSCGMYAEDGDIDVRKAEVHTTGGAVVGNGSAAYSYGAYAYYSNVHITGGEIEANGGTADSSAGICASDTISVTGGTVTAGGNAAAGGTGYGLWAEYGSVFLLGGRVTSAGGETCSESYGIYADSGNTILFGQAPSLSGRTNTIYTTAMAYQGGLLSDLDDIEASVIIRWDNAGGGTVYPVKTNTDLFVEKGSVDAWWVWDYTISGSGIAYGDASDKDNPDDRLPFPMVLVAGPIHVRGIELESGQYLANGASSVSSAKPGVGYAYYNNGVLTLHDAHVTAADGQSGIVTAYDLAIVLEGTNTVVSGDGSHVCGVYAVGDITISGGGSLDVTGGEDRALAGESCALYSYYGSVTVDGGHVTAHGGVSSSAGYGIRAREDINISAGTVEAAGGTVECLSGTISYPGMPIIDLNEGIGYSYGIYSENGNLNVTGGNVIATGGQTDGLNCKSYGVRASDIYIGSGTVEVHGGQANHSSYGMYAFYDMTISGGSVTADASSDCQRDGCGLYAEENIDITSGTIHTTGGDNAERYSSGIHTRSGKVMISGGQTEAFGGTGSGYSHGVHAGTGMSVSGLAKVTATGGGDTNTSYGITAYGDFSAADNAEVYATGGNSNGLRSGGVDVYGSITISGKAKLNAASGSAPLDYGISYGVNSNRVTVAGGSLTATSDQSSDSKGMNILDGAFFESGSIIARGETIALMVYTGGLHIADTMTVQGAADTNGTLEGAAIYTDGNNMTVHLGADGSGASTKYVSIVSPSSDPDGDSPAPSYDSFTITAMASKGGSISPSGSTMIREGLDKTYNIIPQSGYVISDVTVDGVSVKNQLVGNSYTFRNVQSGHTIHAAFIEESKVNPDTGDNASGAWPYLMFAGLAACTMLLIKKKRAGADGEAAGVWRHQKKSD